MCRYAVTQCACCLLGRERGCQRRYTAQAPLGYHTPSYHPRAYLSWAQVRRLCQRRPACQHLKQEHTFTACVYLS